MTTNIKVSAHCASNKRVTIERVNSSNTFTEPPIHLNDGETYEVVVFDDFVVSVREELSGDRKPVGIAPPTQEIHANMVVALAKPGETIRAELTAHDAHLVHMTIGISGEAGELLDAIKKAAVYRKPLDRANVIEELGDIEFYMEGLRQGLGITREETLQANIAKLSKRYGQFEYSDQAAQNRADKPEGQ